MNPPTEPLKRRLSLATRMFLLISTLLILAIGSAVLISFRQGSQIAAEAVERSLQSSAAVQGEFAAQRLGEVQLQVQLIAADAAFVNYVDDAQAGAAGRADPSLTESASIYDLLLERQESYGFDLGLILNQDGAVLARTDQPEAFEQSLAQDPFVISAVTELRPISGFWRMADRVYQTAIWPLDRNQNLVGFLIVAKAVDDGLSQQIRQISDADVAFLIPVDGRIEIIGTSLPSASRATLQRQLAADAAGIASAVRSGTPMEQLELDLDGFRWVGRLSPLDIDGGPQVGAALQLSSSAKAEAGYRAILNSVALAGIAAIIFALPLSLVLAKATLRPLRDMARMATDAVAGQYQSRIGLGGNDELAELSHAFDSLLSDLRGERDIESYVTNLSRLLPEPGDEPPAPSAPASPEIKGRPSRSAQMTLVAIDTRKRLLPGAEQGADQNLQQVGEFTSGVLAAAEDFRGELLASTGPRMLLGFAGTHRQDQALRFVREIFLAEREIALAAIDGEVTVGSIHGDTLSISVAVGLPIQQLERLLAEAWPGRLLLPKSLGETVRAQLGDASVRVIKGAISGKPFYCTDLEGLGQLPAAIEPTVPTASAVTQLRTASELATTRRPAATLAAGGDLAAGSQLGERFRILSVLGTGGMGVVYKARDLELDDVVALKMLKGDAVRDAEQLERLKSEIKLARRITHTNVLRTFDFGEVDGQPFISMEYVRGMTLRYLIKQSERVPFTAALRIARQLCAGLQAAHEVGVLHRDIKPENLILEASGNAKLMDFGIARPIRRTSAGSTEPGTYVGTPAYSAPEQLSAQDVDHRADIFASGVLMSEMFCGQLPFAGSSTVEIYMAQMEDAPRRPSASWAEIPAELEAIILRCIERRPEDRFQSAAALASALSALRA